MGRQGEPTGRTDEVAYTGRVATGEPVREDQVTTAGALPRATTSLCAICKHSVPAQILREGERVVMRKTCPRHGEAEVLVSPDADWYARTIAEAPLLTPPEPQRPVAQGCPFDCGPCAAHEQSVVLPIVPITGACNLDCPICYTHNKNEGAWHMSEAELDGILGHLRRAAPDRRMINLTGGEPTLHPDFARLVARCVAEGIHRVTISTHGLRFLKEPWLLEEGASGMIDYGPNTYRFIGCAAIGVGAGMIVWSIIPSNDVVGTVGIITCLGVWVWTWFAFPSLDE